MYIYLIRFCFSLPKNFAAHRIGCRHFIGTRFSIFVTIHIKTKTTTTTQTNLVPFQLFLFQKYNKNILHQTWNNNIFFYEKWSLCSVWYLTNSIENIFSQNLYLTINSPSSILQTINVSETISLLPVQHESIFPVVGQTG